MRKVGRVKALPSQLSHPTAEAYLEETSNDFCLAAISRELEEFCLLAEVMSSFLWFTKTKHLSSAFLLPNRKNCCERHIGTLPSNLPYPSLSASPTTSLLLDGVAKKRSCIQRWNQGGMMLKITPGIYTWK